MSALRTVAARIAREEWRAMFRDRAAVAGLALLTVLMLVAAITAHEHQRNADAERARYQSQANHEFAAQPDRHPHRMVHYGHFLFRPVYPLATFDPGIGGFTGNTLFLEGHRQNSANFGDVRQASLLLRFGQLTPAFVLQVLAPLLLVFFGHAAVARERESGTLRILLAQGVRSRQLVLGKLLALAAFAGLALLPALATLAWLAAAGHAPWQLALLLGAGYSGWLLLWAVGVVLVSLLARRGRDALLALLACWAVLVILLPRWAPGIASTAVALPTRFEDTIHVQRDYLALGDSHDPNDRGFVAFRDALLKKYGVRRIEDLPVNFKGLVGMEGERRSAELFNRYAADAFARQQRQGEIIDAFGWLSPTLALQRLSMAAAGTDLANYRGFLEQAEHYRYTLIQGLNRLQVERLAYADDTTPGRENRIARALATIPRISPPAAPAWRDVATGRAGRRHPGAVAGGAGSAGMGAGGPAGKDCAMNGLRFELRLVLRSRLSAATLALLLLLSALAVWSGVHEVERQRRTIARLAPLHAQDVAALAVRHPDSDNAGTAAYYTFYDTWDPPTGAAFLALGLRDVAPYVLRVRALGLQAQLYEGETFNPELALPGRFDFAFVLIYLAPLFVIALLHDLVSIERQSGRLRMLLALPGAGRLWWRRAALRGALLFGCLALPALAGAAWSGTGTGAIATVLAVTAAYVAFWTGLSLLVAARGWRSVANAMALMGAWTVLTLVLPALANVALVRAIPVHQGVDLMLAQRQAVHGAWDIPRDETMRKFLAGHPQWRDTAPLPPHFHWKWYFAFHQLGDESVAGAVRDYRDGLLARQAWTGRLGWLLPGVAAQGVLHRLANTDLPAQLAYQDGIAAHHKAIREFYYNYLFNERRFGTADFARRPAFAPAAPQASPPWRDAWVLFLLAGAVLLAGAARLGRSGQHGGRPPGIGQRRAGLVRRELS